MKRDFLKHLGFYYNKQTSLTMNRKAHCNACALIARGVKSRIPLEHTCGLEPGEISEGNTTNITVPTEIDPEILWDQHSALIGDDLDDLSYWSGRDVMKKSDFLLVATEYALKWQEAQQEIKDWESVNADKNRLVREIDNIISGGLPAKQASLCDLVNPIRELQEKHNAAIDLLEKFISRHEAGLPHAQIYNDIKTFLDGK